MHNGLVIKSHRPQTRDLTSGPNHRTMPLITLIRVQVMSRELKARFAHQSGELSGEDEGYLDGQLLIAMPAMNDPNFQKSVIYVCAHSDEGAVGLVINQPATGVSFSEVLEQLDVSAPADGNQPIVIGGPVETGRGFVLHSIDYCKDDATLVTRERIGMTATIDILKAMAEGRGPEKALLAIGYSGWGPGQLESEIQANGWLTCPAEDALVFDDDFNTKWDRAIEILGIDPAFLSSDFGHA